MTDRWFRFYDGALNDPKVQRLSPVLFKTWVNLLCLASASREDGRLPETADDIAFALRMDPVECGRHIDALAQAELIDLEVGTGREAMHNWVSRQYNKPSDTPEATRERQQEKRARDRSKAEEAPQNPVTPEPENVSRACHAPVTPHIQIQRREDSEKTQSREDPDARGAAPGDEDAPAARCARDGLDGFQSLWEAYPNHAGRAKAEAAFAKLRPPTPLLEQMQSAITRAKQTDQWQRGVIPHLATWLNGQRWTDELPTPITAMTPHARNGPKAITSAVGQVNAIERQIERARGDRG